MSTFTEQLDAYRRTPKTVNAENLTKIGEMVPGTKVSTGLETAVFNAGKGNDYVMNQNGEIEEAGEPQVTTQQ